MENTSESSNIINIVFPDNTIRQYDSPSTGTIILSSLSSKLRQLGAAIKVNGKLQDLSDSINSDAVVEIITVKDAQGIEIMRHTITAQVLARAIKNLFPNSMLAIGPVIKDGFYYDISTPHPISIHDLEIIENEMRNIIQDGHEIIKKIVPREEAIKLFKERGENYKVQIIQDTNDLNFQIYYQGDTDFIDLCHGPHLPSLKKAGVFKLTKIAGAYWRGDSQNEMLTRIYGTAWNSKEELENYVQKIEEAERRDHRKICQAMDLLHFQGEAPGQVFWHDKGWTMYKELENYIRTKLKVRNYEEVNTPKIINKDLFVQSGHWEKFGTGEMFILNAYENFYALKPMNCPCHVQIYKQKLHSYKDLPIKLSEFGNCLRQEARGALHGLMRVTSMTQDDAHIFCTVDQIKEQVVEISNMIIELYTELGFCHFFVRYADRPEQRVGDDALWDVAEKSLVNAAEEAGINWVLNKGEGAFYGPKLEFVLTDAIGREWQCGTIQLDFNLPKRLEAKYIGVDGEKHYPVMIHRALLGSMERFLGIFIEHYAGNFPLWIAPTHLVISGVTDKHISHARVITEQFKKAGIRVVHDTRNEKINYKIREHVNSKVIYIGIIGDKEIADNTITVRRLGIDGQVIYELNKFLEIMKHEIEQKTLPPQFRELQNGN